MIANRRKLGTTARKSSRRLPEVSGHCIDRPVMLPPGCARLATRPAPTGSTDNARTIGMPDVAFFAWGAAGPVVTMTLTLRRTNSAALGEVGHTARPILPTGARERA